MGTCATGRRMSGTRLSKLSVRCSKIPRHAAASVPSDARVRSRSRGEHARPPVVERVGEVEPGHSHRSPWRSSPSELRNGETTPVGWNAEQSSCSSPGSVELRRPGPPARPVSGLEDRDLQAGLGEPVAAARPLGPLPTTAADVSCAPAARGPVRPRPHGPWTEPRAGHGEPRPSSPTACGVNGVPVAHTVGGVNAQRLARRDLHAQRVAAQRCAGAAVSHEGGLPPPLRPGPRTTSAAPTPAPARLPSISTNGRARMCKHQRFTQCAVTVMTRWPSSGAGMLLRRARVADPG